MGHPIKIMRSNGALTASLPDELAEQLQIKEGDKLFAEATEEGILLTFYDYEFERAMEAYRRVAPRYHDAFRQVTK